MARKRLSDDEVEALMVPKIIDALYPIFYPVEQQDCRIQAEHQAKVASVALGAWRAFLGLK